MTFFGKTSELSAFVFDVCHQHYKAFGLSQTCNQEEIDRAYRKLALQHHPDKQGSAVMFKVIGGAAAVLRNPDCRQVYDEFLDFVANAIVNEDCVIDQQSLVQQLQFIQDSLASGTLDSTIEAALVLDQLKEIPMKTPRDRSRSPRRCGKPRGSVGRWTDQYEQLIGFYVKSRGGFTVEIRQANGVLIVDDDQFGRELPLHCVDCLEFVEYMKFHGKFKIDAFGGYFIEFENGNTWTKQ